MSIDQSIFKEITSYLDKNRPYMNNAEGLTYAGYGILTEYKDKFIAESLEEYYNKTEPLNKGELKVLLCKPFDYNQHLVLAEKYSGDGHTSSDLFLLDPYFNVNAVTNVLVPLSPCFSLGQVFLGGKTILFGTFDDTKYIPQDDKVVQVKINEIKAELESGEKVTEKVDMDKGYILIFNGESPVKSFDLYNDKQELQSVITDSVVSETEMYFNID